ncbi:MAG: hypothetical protein LBI12_06340, partial [Treponema sp.]|nr:hypothetical protein [Treponema sp.]
KENFDPTQIKNAFSQPRSLPLGIKEYRGNGDYVFEDSCISHFFSLKSGIIFQNLRRICRYFKEKGLGVGLDVFAPFLSPFVGQNLPLLSGLCDFMKPMMYRLTNAPAGLPFEMQALLSNTIGEDTLKKKFFYELLNFDPGKKVFDIDFAVKELDDLAVSSACPIYAGLEINRVEKFAEVYPEYVEETTKAYSKANIQGFALSWNMLDAPAENIARFGEAMARIN